MGEDDQGVEKFELQDFYGEIRRILEVTFEGGAKELLLDVNWHNWVKPHPTQRLCKRVQLQYSLTGTAPRENDQWKYFDRSEPWVLASAVDHQIFLTPDLCDLDYHQIFTLHTTDYHAPPNLVADPEQYKDSTLRKFKRKLP